MAPKLYAVLGSPCVRSVLIVAKAIELELDIYIMNWEKAEYLSPEYLKINPQHTVPTLDDDGKIIWDSHAINTYLVEKYGKDDSLYPKDLHLRALVNQRLYFDAGVLFPALYEVDWALIKKEIKRIQPKQKEIIRNGYGFLEKFLESRMWAIGDQLTVADFSLMTTVTSLEVHVVIDQKTYPNITAWLKKVRALPCCSQDHERLQLFTNYMKELIS